MLTLAISTLFVLSASVSDVAISPLAWEIPKEYKAEDKVVRLNGSGLCEWGWFGVDLYRAALYLEKTSRKPETVISSKQVKVLAMQFSRKLSIKQLKKAWQAGFRENAGEKLSKYQKRLDEFKNKLVEAREGDWFLFTVCPGQGLKVKLKDAEPFLIRGDDFAEMFIRCYVGEKPATKQLKRGLLGLD